MFSHPVTEGRYEHIWQGFAVVDLETTGLDPEHDRIVEIAVVRIDAAGRELGVYETLVQPGTEVRGTAVHGITDDHVAHAPTFAEIAGSVLAWLEGVVVVAHNAAFEEAFLQTQLRRTGLEPPVMPALDTLRLSQTHLPLTNHRLAGLCARYGVDLTDPHTATGDARATAQVLARMLRELPGTPRWDVPVPPPRHSVSGRYLPRRAVRQSQRGGTLER